MSLSSAEIQRYGRHMVMPEVGREGQERLKAARVLLVGTGGLGSPAALYLAAAGVGTLGLVEFDRVEITNLHRQILYGEADLGRLKLPVAKARLREVNPHVEIVEISERLDVGNALGLVGGYDVVVDGSDNFPTRYLVNDACVLAGKPDVFGSVLRFEGQVSVFAAAGGPCYRCLFPEPPPAGLVPSCAEGGVFGVLPGVIGSLQAHETIKLLLDLGQPLIGRFLVFDGIQLRFREITLSRDPHCPICSDNATKTTLVASGGGCELPSRVEDEEMAVPFDISPAEVQAWRDEGHEFRILDVRTPAEYAIARIDDATLVPLDQLSTRLDELDREEEIVVLCHHGIRSAHAVAFLRRQGLVRVRNLSGGIAAWSRDVDDSVPQY